MNSNVEHCICGICVHSWFKDPKTVPKLAKTLKTAEFGNIVTIVNTPNAVREISMDATRDHWRRLRVVQVAFLGVLVSGPALFALTSLAIVHLQLKFLAFAIPCISVAFLVGIGAFGMICTLWRCPRCHRRFFTNHIVTNQFSKKCMHCGLLRGEERPPQTPE